MKYNPLERSNYILLLILFMLLGVGVLAFFLENSWINRLHQEGGVADAIVTYVGVSKGRSGEKLFEIKYRFEFEEKEYSYRKFGVRDHPFFIDETLYHKIEEGMVIPVHFNTSNPWNNYYFYNKQTVKVGFYISSCILLSILMIWALIIYLYNRKCC